jgi:hypothetical protein
MPGIIVVAGDAANTGTDGGGAIHLFERKAADWIDVADGPRPPR